MNSEELEKLIKDMGQTYINCHACLEDLAGWDDLCSLARIGLAKVKEDAFKKAEDQAEWDYYKDAM